MSQPIRKLVRDRIPALIRATGKTCTTRILSKDAYRAALRTKLEEEAQEAATAVTQHELVTELADLVEVMEALMAAYGIDPDQVRAVQSQRRAERGGFRERLWLDTVDP